jgi:hypothetical protein
MTGEPLELAKQACAGIVRNLRLDDLFSVIVFDEAAEVVIPLQKPVDRHGMADSIARITAGSSTNLMAGWLLGRDELLKAGQDCDKKVLLLTDGHLNQGIIEPENVEALTRSGFSKDAIRTSCLGFGDNYNEVVLATMSSVGTASCMTRIRRKNSQLSWRTNSTGSRKSPLKTFNSGLSQGFSVTRGRNSAITRQSTFPMAGSRSRWVIS